MTTNLRSARNSAFISVNICVFDVSGPLENLRIPLLFPLLFAVRQEFCFYFRFYLRFARNSAFISANNCAHICTALELPQLFAEILTEFCVFLKIPQIFTENLTEFCERSYMLICTLNRTLCGQKLFGLHTNIFLWAKLFLSNILINQNKSGPFQEARCKVLVGSKYKSGKSSNNLCAQSTG